MELRKDPLEVLKKQQSEFISKIAESIILYSDMKKIVNTYGNKACLNEKVYQNLIEIYDVLKNNFLINMYPEEGNEDLYNNPTFRKIKIRRIEKFSLKMEMLPLSAWHKSLAYGLITKEDWDILRKWAYSKENYHCQICGLNQKDIKAGLHGHEIWEFDQEKEIQKLINIIAICPECHHSIHIGYSISQGEEYFTRIKQHYMKINHCSEREFEFAHDLAIDKFEKLGFTSWTLDISFAYKMLEKLKVNALIK